MQTRNREWKYIIVPCSAMLARRTASYVCSCWGSTHSDFHDRRRERNWTRTPSLFVVFSFRWANKKNKKNWMIYPFECLSLLFNHSVWPHTLNDWNEMIQSWRACALVLQQLKRHWFPIQCSIWNIRIKSIFLLYTHCDGDSDSLFFHDNRLVKSTYEAVVCVWARPFACYFSLFLSCSLRSFPSSTQHFLERIISSIRVFHARWRRKKKRKLPIGFNASNTLSEMHDGNNWRCWWELCISFTFTHVHWIRLAAHTQPRTHPHIHRLLHAQNANF